MMKSVIFAAAAALSVCAFSQPIDSNAVVAKIDGQTITAAQFYHRMAYMDGVGTVEDGKFVSAGHKVS